jgi:hypothetical protein
VSIPDGELSSDHCAEAIRATFNGGAIFIDAPINLGVRWPACVPLLGILDRRYWA